MTNRLWIPVAAILGIAILAMGWFLGVSPKLDEMNAANEQRASVEAQNRIHEARLAELKKQFEKIDELRADLALDQVALPPGDELSTFLGQLHSLEGSSGVVLQTFSASDGQSYLPAEGAEAPSGLVTADNFIAITIDLTVSGTREQVIDFVNDLQYGDRLFLVTKLTVSKTEGQQETDAGDYTGSISGFVYVLVDPSAPPPTPTPVGSLDTGPSPSPSPSP